MHTAEDLKNYLNSELKEFAEKAGVKNYKKLNKEELIKQILDKQTEAKIEPVAEAVESTFDNNRRRPRLRKPLDDYPPLPFDKAEPVQAEEKPVIEMETIGNAPIVEKVLEKKIQIPEDILKDFKMDIDQIMGSFAADVKEAIAKPTEAPQAGEAPTPAPENIQRDNRPRNDRP